MSPELKSTYPFSVPDYFFTVEVKAVSNLTSNVFRVNVLLLYLQVKELILAVMGDFKILFFNDDDHDDLYLMKEISAELGHQAQFFRNGREMLDVLSDVQNKPNIIFLDINMPLINGYEILKVLRSKPEFDDVPIVIHSGNCGRDCIDRCLELGANYYMTKAYSYNGLKAAVEHAVSKDWSDFKTDLNNFLHQHT